MFATGRDELYQKGLHDFASKQAMGAMQYEWKAVCQSVRQHVCRVIKGQATRSLPLTMSPAENANYPSQSVALLSNRHVGLRNVLA